VDFGTVKTGFAAAAGRTCAWVAACLVGVLPLLGAADKDAVVSGIEGRFVLRIGARSSGDGSASWELKAEGAFFIGGDRALAESEYVLPGGQSKERVALLVDGGARKCYLLFRDTLNYRQLVLPTERMAELVALLPALKEFSYVSVKKLLASAGAKLESAGRQRVEGELLDAFAVVSDASASPSAPDETVAVHLYFKPATGMLRVISIDTGEATLRVVLQGIRNGARRAEELRVPDGYYELAARNLAVGEREGE